MLKQSLSMQTKKTAVIVAVIGFQVQVAGSSCPASLTSLQPQLQQYKAPQSEQVLS